MQRLVGVGEGVQVMVGQEEVGEAEGKASPTTAFPAGGGIQDNSLLFRFYTWKMISKL